MISRKYICMMILVCVTLSAIAQTESKYDTIIPKLLDSVTIKAYLGQITMRPLPSVQGTYIFSGKKTEVIDLQQTAVTMAEKTGRHVFAKVPGVFVYDMDGAGNQVNISTRGLDPHRGWEFNTRKDGVIINSDMYGYPASHYSMPLESIERIELVRGTGSLQYGAQFGGMLNYVNKQGDTSRPFSFESINTVGSFNLLSTFNAIGGKVGKFRYYAYISKKSRGGYRDNEHTDSDAEDIVLSYEPHQKFSVRLEWARSTYLYKIPGPITDKQFEENPQQASRSRNYFSPDIHIPSITINWQIAAFTKIQLISSAVLGKRNSVLFDKPTNVPDTINSATLQYNNRQVDIDAFNSYTTEFRLLQQYRLGKQTSTLAAGVQYMNNDLHRTQLGKGTTGSDYDLTLVTPGWGRDVHLKTKNIALFIENNFQLTENFSTSIGARMERGDTKMSGTIVYYPDEKLPVSIEHDFPLLGASFSYKPKRNMELYGGFSQAYHPMLFKDLIPSSTFEKVDPNIKDAKGYNAEIGFRGNWKFLRWDVTGYLLQYNDRFGTLSETDANGNFYLYRTNIGNSLTKGLELFLQGDWLLGNNAVLSFFTSTAFVDARYQDASLKSGNANINIDNNKVETVPDVITRNGATFRFNKISIGAMYSYTGVTYADALNTMEPSPTTAAVGRVAAYGLLDINSTLRINSHLLLRVNVNNLTDKQYFTKRPSFYPGPGVWSSDGRNINGTIIIHI